MAVATQRQAGSRPQDSGRYGKAAKRPQNVLANPSQMRAGEALRPQLDKKNKVVSSGGTYLVFRTSGDLALQVNGKWVWHSNTAQSNVSRLSMQADGNLAIYDNSGYPVWASDTMANPGAYLSVEGGDAKVISPTGKTLWSAVGDAKGKKDRRKSHGDSLIAMLALNPIGIIAGRNTWVGNVIGTAGRPVAQASHALQDESGKIVKALDKIPVVGGLFVGLYDAVFWSSGLGPMVATEQIIVEGYGVDTVVLAKLKEELKDFKAVGPYAQMVCSFIPGVGTYIAGAIGCGLALANGEPIGEAILSGVEGMLPGGPLAKMACDVARAGIEAAVEHKKITWTSIAQEGISAAASAISLPDAAKDALEGALTCATSLMQGKTIDRALAAGVADALPVGQEAKSAIVQCVDIAHNIAQGQRVDRVLLAHVDKLSTLLPIDAKYQRSISAGLDVGVAVAQKKKVDKVLQMRLAHAVVDIGMSEGKKHFPKSAVNALQIGMSVTHARMVQDVAKSQIVGSVTKKLQTVGQGVIRDDNVVRATYESVVKQGHTGFQVGTAAMRYRMNVNQLMTTRNGLSEEDRGGFDLACSLHVGRVANPPSDSLSDVHAQVGYFITHGVQGGYPSQKQAQVEACLDDPTVAVGVKTAMNKIAIARSSWWTRLLIALGIKEVPS
jgi:hypothetical protein